MEQPHNREGQNVRMPLVKPRYTPVATALLQRRTKIVEGCRKDTEKTLYRYDKDTVMLHQTFSFKLHRKVQDKSTWRVHTSLHIAT